MKLGTLVRLAARNTLRRRMRTLLTAGMVVFGVSLLLIALTWVRGISGQMIAQATELSGHVRVVDPDYAAREELLPLHENLERTAPLVTRIEASPGVLSVEPRISAGVTVTVGEEIGDVFAMAVGANERYFRERLKAHEKLASGAWFTGGEDELIAGARVAKEAGAKVGDELVLLGMTQDGSLSPIKGRLVAVIQGGSAMLDQQVLVPLEKMRWLTDIPEGATELLVFGESYSQGPALARSLRGLPELQGHAVQSWNEREPWKTLAASASAMQGVIIFIIVFLTALGIWNTMMMSVLERTHEIGVLRAMGLSRLGAIGLFVGEALAIGVGGGAVGLALGAVPAWLLEEYGIRIGERTAGSMSVPISETVRGDLNLENVLMAFGLGLLMAVLGSTLPALRAASIQPVSAMRSGR